MIRHTLFGISLFAVAVANPASAEVLASDSFEYAATGTLGSQSSAGDGWSSGWTENSSLTTASDASVIASSLDAPDGYGPTSGGSAASNSILAYRGLASAAQMDLGVDDDYYMSYLVQRNQNPGTGSFTVFYQDSSASNVAFSSVSTGGTPSINLAGTTTAATANAIGYGFSYLVVMKFSASSAGSDQVFMKVYFSGSDVEDTETTTWNVVSSMEDSSSVISQIGFVAGGSNVQLQIDEVLVGETWADVVPEPGTLGLLALGLLMTRRRAGA